MSLNKVYATSWGLSYPNNGSEPYVNIDKNIFIKNNVYYRGDSSRKNIYLTFDAGYDNGNTAKILDVLKKLNIHATFFITGYVYESQPDLVKRMVNEGHIVGNHTDDHKNMSTLSKQEFIRQIIEIESKYYQLIGKPMSPKVYRPPEGRYTKENLEWAKELGYSTIFWSLTLKDWDTKNQMSNDKALELLNKRIHNGAIILMHSVSSTNANILETLIKDYSNKGYKIRELSHLLVGDNSLMFD